MFPVHTIESAPVGAQAPLQGLLDALGAIPNLAGAMAESPELLRGFLSIREILYSGTFTAIEVQVLALTNAFENRCAYCMALHSAFALKAGLPRDEVERLRAGEPPTDPRLGALSDLSRRLVRHRARGADAELQGFLRAGYTRGQALEVVLGVAVSILPNFAHHLTACPVDAAFAPQRWSATDA